MSARARHRLAGAMLLSMVAVGMVAVLARAYVSHNYHHVEATIFNVNDMARLSVNCRVAELVHHGRSAEVDLGWLDPSDDLYFGVFNKDGGTAWGLRLEIDGERVVSIHRGHADSVGLDADERSWVMARGYGADGDELGTVGCAAPLVTSPRLSEYRRVPEASHDGHAPGWDAPTFPFALIDTVGEWGPLAIALVGFTVALLNAAIRGFVRERWQWGFIVGLLGLGITLGAIDLGVLFLVLEAVGFVLLTLAGVLWLRQSVAGSAGTP